MGVVERVFSPINEGLKLVTNAAGNVLNTGKGVVRSVGNGSRRVLGRVTHGLNSAGNRLLTGKRRQGGGRRGKSMKSRKMHKKRMTRKNRKDRKNRH